MLLTKNIIRKLKYSKAEVELMPEIQHDCEAADAEKNVAKVSYMCVVRSPGHCWIYVENISV